MPFNYEIGHIWTQNSDLNYANCSGTVQAFCQFHFWSASTKAWHVFGLDDGEELEFAKVAGSSYEQDWVGQSTGEAESDVEGLRTLCSGGGGGVWLLFLPHASQHFPSFCSHGSSPRLAQGSCTEQRWAQQLALCTHGEGGEGESPPPQEALKLELNWRNERINFLLHYYIGIKSKWTN